MRWWQAGLLGGISLTLATAIKFVGATVCGVKGDFTWGEAAGFILAVFGMGFLCGVVGWAGRGLHHRIGIAGDAIVGMAVMVIFFSCCMLLFAPEMLGTRFRSAGAPMFALAVAVGLICGPWFGRDLRREFSGPENSRREDDLP